MDALMIVCFNSRFTYSLTRANIFKKPLARWLLTSMNMIPIYRIRDGWQSLAENKKTFESCDRLFLKNKAVIIFPEGNHASQRRLRPLSKGFARIAFESLQQHPELTISIVPVGLSYSNPTAFRSSVSVYFGKPLLANDYFQPSDSFGTSSLRNELALRLKKMITHVEDVGRYAEIIERLEKTHPNYLDPYEMNASIARIEKGEVLSTRSVVEPKNRIIGWPLQYFARLINFLPLLVWGRIRNQIKDPVFITSLKFGTGIFLFPAFYGLVGWLLYTWAGPWIAGGWWAVSFFSTRFLRND